MKKIVRLTESDLKRLIKKVIKEQSVDIKRSLSSDMESGDILIVTDKTDKQNKIEVVQPVPVSGGFIGNLNNKKTKFLFGRGENQIKYINTEPNDFDFTVNMIEIKGKQFPVKEDGSF